MQLPTISKALVIPNAALRYQGDKTGVWKLIDGGLQFTAVKLAAGGMDGSVQIIGGLSKGERVVVYSEKELKADSAIKVVTALTGSGK